MERFENAIFKQREEINDRMAEMFGILKELTTSRALKNVLIREEAKSPITKNVNSISLARGEEERNEDNDVATSDDIEKPTKIETGMPVKGPVYEAILRKKITRMEDIRRNFKIPYNIGGLKHMNSLVNQGSNVNIIPLSTYMKLTDERLAKTDIRLFLASHSYIYPLGIAKDVLVEVAKHVYPIDFMILDIKEDEKRQFILGTPFLTTAKAGEKGIKNDIEPIALIVTVNRLVLEWEEKIKLHQEMEMKFHRWRNKNFKHEHPTLVKIKDEVDDDGEVT
ncbi:class II heat shock protein [Tanacetum coccineum]